MEKCHSTTLRSSSESEEQGEANGLEDTISRGFESVGKGNYQGLTRGARTSKEKNEMAEILKVTESREVKAVDSEKTKSQEQEWGEEISSRRKKGVGAIERCQCQATSMSEYMDDKEKRRRQMKALSYGG